MTEDQIRHRINRIMRNNGIHNYDEIFRTIHSAMIDNDNSYLQSLLSIQEQLDQGNIPETFEIGLHVDKRPTGEHSRRYNLPTTNEIAISLPNEIAISLPNENDEDLDLNRMITKYRNDNDNLNLRIMTDSHRSYDPMMYPTFFPGGIGIDGWHLITYAEILIL